MMDTSETYIKICDCPEIQGQLDDFEDGLNNDNCAYSKPVKNGGHPVWLPRQDQIQEMFGEVANLRYFSGLIEGFFRFSTTGYGVEQKTFEQLWLAFYMHEKHGKVWDGKKWIKK